MSYGACLILSNASSLRTSRLCVLQCCMGALSHAKMPPCRDLTGSTEEESPELAYQSISILNPSTDYIQEPYAIPVTETDIP